MNRDELAPAIGRAPADKNGRYDGEADVLLPIVDAYVAAERERLAQEVEELPGQNGAAIRKWPKRDREIYMLAIEEAAERVRAGGQP